MKKSNYSIAAIAFCVSVMAVGVSYWQLPYSQVALPNSLFGIGMLVAIVAGVSVRATGNVESHETLLMIGGVFVAVVLIRIFFDVMKDPETHGLWPFELIISSIVGLIVGAIAAGIGNIANSFRASNDSK